MCTRRKTAFTMAEALVLIVMLAVLIGVIVPALGQARARSHQAVCLANLRAIGAATQSYANDDSNELLLPIHQMMVRNTSIYAGVLGEWGWRLANWVAWGGATASEDFRTGMAAPQPLGQFDTPFYAASTRPLTMYLYPDLEEVIHPLEQRYVTDLSLFRCPDDRGYPDDPRVDDSPAANANRPCYATLGNSYRAPLSALYLTSSGSADYQGAFSMSAWGHRRSDLTNGSRLTLLGDPLFFNMLGIDDDSGGETIDLAGWHGEFLKDNVLYVDGTARLTKATPLTAISPEGYLPISYRFRDWFSRGETFQLDTYPTPGAYIWGPARPRNLGVSGDELSKWPWAGYKDNLSGGRLDKSLSPPGSGGVKFVGP